MLFLCLLFISSKANAQLAYFKNLTVDDGLSQSSVTTIMQDSRGYMWFGTQDGLNRYDGKNIKVYKSYKGDSTSVIGNFINKIIELKNKELLIGTASGVCKYNPVFDKFQAFEKSKLEGYSIKCLLEDSKGRIWMGSTLGLLLKNTNGTINSFFDEGSQKRNIINIVENKSNGKICVVTDKSIYFYDENEKLFTQNNYTYNESSQIINAVFNGNNLLFITERFTNNTPGSVKIFDINTNSYVKPPKWLGDMLKKYGIIVINSICTLENNTSFITTDNNGFLKMKGDSIILAYNKINNCSSSDLLSNKILCTYKDKQNRIWIGQDIGVSCSLLDNVKFQSINAPFFNSKNIKSSDFMSLYVDDKNYILGTSGDGFYLVDRVTNKLIPFSRTTNFGNLNGVLSILKLSDKKIITGAWGGGGYCF